MFLRTAYLEWVSGFIICELFRAMQFLKAGCPSLLGKDCFYETIWRVELHEQKESCEAAILRMEGAE